MRRWIWNVLVWLDQGANTLLGGDPDETISSRAAKARDTWWGRNLCRVLATLDPDHCATALEADEGKNALYATSTTS